MGRIESRFAELRDAKQPGLVTYVTAGDPDYGSSRDVLLALERAGADVIEVGVPFSDPIAEGPPIQRPTERALAAGGNLARTLDLVADVRGSISAPLVLFTYVNPVVRMGARAFAERAAACRGGAVRLLHL